MYSNIISIEELLSLTDEELAERHLRPIAGADGDDDDKDKGGAGGGSDDDDADKDKDAGGGGGDDDADKDKGGSGDDDGDDDDDDDGMVKIPKSEEQRLRRAAKEHEKARRQAEKEARERSEREKREQGKYEELLSEKDERIREVEAERDTAKLELHETLRRIRVTAAAVRFGFKDPQDAIDLLPEDQTEDDSSTERALKRLARQKPYLLDKRRQSGSPDVNGGGGTLTAEEIKQMSPEEINARWPEVQKAMAAQGQQ